MIHTVVQFLSKLVQAFGNVKRLTWCLWLWTRSTPRCISYLLILFQTTSFIWPLSSSCQL